MRNASDFLKFVMQGKEILVKTVHLLDKTGGIIIGKIFENDFNLYNRLLTKNCKGIHARMQFPMQPQCSSF